MSEGISQLTVKQANGPGKSDVSVVEVNQTAKCTCRQDNNCYTANFWQHLTMDVILNHSRQAPANTQIHYMLARKIVPRFVVTVIDIIRIVEEEFSRVRHSVVA